MSSPKINFFAEDISFTLKNKRIIRSWVSDIIVRKQKIPGGINFVFCNDDYLLRMNKQYLDHDTLTDIITFQGNEGNTVIGDIFISVERVKENAIKFAVPFSNELHRVIIHGVLHLLGYSDKSKSQKEKMRKLEDECLLSLTI